MGHAYYIILIYGVLIYFNALSIRSFVSSVKNGFRTLYCSSKIQFIPSYWWNPMLQEILNHGTPQITLKHIETNKEEKNNILGTFQI